MTTELVFGRAPLTNPSSLVFGDLDGAAPDRDASLSVTFPLTFSASVGGLYDAALSVTFPAMTFGGTVIEPPALDLAVNFPPLAFSATVGGYTAASLQATVSSPLTFSAGIEDFAGAVDLTLTATFDITFAGYVQTPVDAALSASFPMSFAASVGGFVQADLDATVNLPLSFNATVAPPIEADLNATINLPLSFTALVELPTIVDVALTFPVFTLDASATYSNDVSRPTVRHVESLHQDAAKTVTGAAEGMQATDPLPSGIESRHEAAAALPAGFAAAFEQGIPTPSDRTAIRHQDADGVLTWLIEQAYQVGNRNSRSQSTARHQDALRLQAARIWTDWQERFRDRRPSLRQAWQEGEGLAKRHSDSAQSGVPHPVGWTALHQEAIVPPPGVTLPPEPPEPPPCYEPDPDLVFQQALALNGNLLFLCQYGDEGPAASVVVPVRRVYVVINNIALRRVDGDVALPCFSLSLSIDADSWTWGFNASLPHSVIASVLPDVNGPIELEANINGTLYRVLAETIARDRSFASDRIRVSGRGKTALLASPYSAIQTFANSTQRTAQQLMADVLTLNGVPLGWTIDWQITDWLVHSGAFNVNGAYIDGLLAVAGAAGAYLQPHPVNQQISVLHRYPSAPWDWDSITPDFEIPSAVATREGLEWVEKPAYNRVYVSGTSQGVLARVTRTGTAGDVAAPMVTDALITAAAAGRQRGIAVLGDTGRQVNVTLRMPVLPATGVITPGKFVRYDDDGTLRLGIVRSTSVDASFPNVWQTLRLETHL